jgi:hypothetical protein
MSNRSRNACLAALVIADGSRGGIVTKSVDVGDRVTRSVFGARARLADVVWAHTAPIIGLLRVSTRAMRRIYRVLRGESV